MPEPSQSESRISELRVAIHRYLQVDGSHGLYDALECGRARRRLIELAGEPELLTIDALRERWAEPREEGE